MIDRKRVTKALAEVLRREANGTAKSVEFAKRLDALKLCLKSDPRGLSCIGSSN